MDEAIILIYNKKDESTQYIKCTSNEAENISKTLREKNYKNIIL